MMPTNSNPLKDYIQFSYKLPSERNEDTCSSMKELTSLLEQMNTRLTRIEDKQDRQDVRIANIEKANISTVSRDNTVDTGDVKTEKTFGAGCRVNTHNTRLPEEDANDATRRKPTRVESMLVRSKSKSPRRPRRYPHTVPSDKDKEANLSNQRRQCLSKAIEANFVEIIQYGSCLNDGELRLPKWLTPSERQYVLETKDPENQMRRFLLHLIDQNFETMQEWLQRESYFDSQTLSYIWKTYEEFNDTSLQKALCFYHKLTGTLNITQVIDHFYSAEIVDVKTMRKVAASDNRMDKQTSLWELTAAQCKKYPVPENVVHALIIALRDAIHKAPVTDECMYKDLLDYMFTNDTRSVTELMTCECEKSCSRLLYPVSLVKDLSLASVYMSPPTMRKEVHYSSPNSSSSSGSDLFVPVTAGEESSTRLTKGGDINSTASQDMADAGENTGNSVISACNLPPRRRIPRHVRNDRRYKTHTSGSASPGNYSMGMRTYANLPVTNFDNSNVSARKLYEGTRSRPLALHANTVYIDNKIIQVKGGHTSQSETENGTSTGNPSVETK